jgi:hypothetical protein
VVGSARLVDKIIIAPHPHKIIDGRRHYTIRAIPYQDPHKRLSGSRRCTRPGSRSSPGSEQQVGRTTKRLRLAVGFPGLCRIVVEPQEKLANFQVELLGGLHAADMTDSRHDDKL